MPEQKLDLDFGTDGVVRSIYDDKLNEFAKDIGELVKICRLSNVEWEETVVGRRGWSIRAAHDPKLAVRQNQWDEFVYECSRAEEHPISLFESREEALVFEKKYYDELMPPKETK